MDKGLKIYRHVVLNSQDWKFTVHVWQSS